MTDWNEPAREDKPQPIINIVGEKVALGPLQRGLAPLYHRWHNDFEVGRFAGTMRPTSLEAEEDRYARVSKDENHADFTIYARQGLAPIGTAGLNYIDCDNRTAEFGIMIGDKTSWSKGYGTEVTRLMLTYGFACLGLHNINLWVNAANERGIRAYQRAGFRMAGRIRQGLRLGGRTNDNILMDCLATEFEGGALTYLLPESSEGNE